MNTDAKTLRFFAPVMAGFRRARTPVLFDSDQSIADHKNDCHDRRVC